MNMQMQMPEHDADGAEEHGRSTNSIQHTLPMNQDWTLQNNTSTTSCTQHLRADATGLTAGT